MAIETKAVLSQPMLRLLEQISGHKYAWAYISRARIGTADALVRRGLAIYGLIHDRDHYDCPEVIATEAGLREITNRWPDSPAARGTYEPPTDRRGDG